LRASAAIVDDRALWHGPLHPAILAGNGDAMNLQPSGSLQGAVQIGLSVDPIACLLS
jgi:hypothetical protein